MAEKSRYASSSVKSGTTSTGDYVTLHGGVPAKKNVDAIDKANTPKKSPTGIGR